MNIAHRQTVLGLAVMALACSAFIATAPAGTIDLGWNAEGIADGALDNWVRDVGPAGAAWSGTGSTKQSGTTNLANVNDWVNSPAYRLVPQKSWQNLFSDAETKKDATWEIVLRPGDWTGNHMIFNTGGNGDGTAFLLEGSTIEFRFQDNSNADQRNFRSFDLSTLGPATDFYHVVGTADVAGQNEGIGELFVNGISRDGPVTSVGAINDWDGSDDAGLGGHNFNIPGTTGYTADPFGGDVAIFNYYGDEILTSGEIADNYAALVPEPSSLALAALGLIGLTLFGGRRSK